MGDVVPINTPPAKILVAVYGSLKQGFYNHKLLDNHNAKLLGEETIPYWLMLNIGYFPAIIPTMNVSDTILIEVYETNASALKSLDRLEGVESNHYERFKVNTKFGDAYIYVYHPRSLDSLLYSRHAAKIMNDGVWTKEPKSIEWTLTAIRDALDPVYRGRVPCLQPAVPAIVSPLPTPTFKPADPEPESEPTEEIVNLNLSIVQEVCNADVPDSAV